MLYHCPPLTDGAGFDVVVLCGWPGGGGDDAAIRRIAAWRAELAVAGGGGWQRDVSQGFWRNALANLLLGVVAASALLLKTVLLRQSHSCVTPFAHESTAAERSALRAEKAKGLRLKSNSSRDADRAVRAEPVVWRRRRRSEKECVEERRGEKTEKEETEEGDEEKE